MLVMIDAIHGKAKHLGLTLDAKAAWERLAAAESPAVSFYLLPLKDMESEEDLYIKMNSRGKPLTEFENFKAHFEQDIGHSGRADEFAHKIDGPWSDLMWPFHGGDNIVDDEFMRFIDYITEICELRDGKLESGRIGTRARAIFGQENPKSGDHLDFLFRAFDVWQDEHRTDGATPVRAIFDRVFSTALPGDDGYDPDKVVLFESPSVNLFEQCCHQFDSQSRRQPSLHLAAEPAAVRRAAAPDRQDRGLQASHSDSAEPACGLGRGRSPPIEHARPPQGRRGPHHQR